MAAFRSGGSLVRQLLSLQGSINASQCTPGLLAVNTAVQSISSQGFSTSSAPNGIHIADEVYSRQRNLINLGNRIPVLSPDTWVAPNAIIIGDVDLFDRVSVWYGAVLRGDLSGIRIGSFSNVQDKTIIHAARSTPTGLSPVTEIGMYVTIGPGCVLRSTTIEDEVIIGERSILAEGSLVETRSILAPGSVLPPGRLVPAGQLWAGNPARFVRALSKDEKDEIAGVAENMFLVTDEHSSEFLPYSYAYRDLEHIKAILEPKSP